MLDYFRKGSGEILVLVHGFLGAKEIFNEVLSRLTDAFDVIAIDLPGHGLSELEKESYSIDDYVDAIVEVLNHEGIKDATWLGHSMGGYIVLAALEKDVPMHRAILAYSSDLADSEEQKEKRTRQQQQIAENGVKSFVDEVIENFFAKGTKQEKIEVAKKIAYQASKEGLVVALEAMKNRQNQQQLLERLEKPVLVIEGSQDNVVKPIETSNSFVQKVITRTGHFGMLEDPEQFFKAVEQFMSN
ncbi:MAG: alpha/beta hydrolase [Lysinibacillus sp.]|nr:alpha/beta hydrolase [Lysinibacillus sp.]